MAQQDGYSPIAAYALIGDCHTAALVSNEGAIDWYCPGRFDAPAVFCRLLDAQHGGVFRLAPTAGFTTRRRYRGATNLLETTFTTAAGQVRLTDFMPVYPQALSQTGDTVGAAHQILRLVEGLSGEVELELSFRPTFDYARAKTAIALASEGGAVAQAGTQYLSLACPGLALESDGAGGLRGRWQTQAGARRWLALTDGDDPPPRGYPAGAATAPADWDRALRQTEAYWQQWARACAYRGPYREIVRRSALTLKLLTYAPTGALVAAPTTSLPEQIGGLRNWDYRFSWLRDSSLILYALLTVGYRAEASAFLAWLDRALGPSPTVMPRILYTLDGRRSRRETTLAHLAGYRGSRPVRIGNAAAHQRQLDIFGEVLGAATMEYHRPGGADAPDELHGSRGDRPPSPETWTLLSGLVEQAARHWQEPDEGIWEVRGGPQHFLYSKLMCWSALACGLRLAEEYQLDAPRRRWTQTRDAIRQAILERGYNAERGTFTQAFGSTALDATALAIPRLGFLPPTDPRVRSTIERIQAELMQNGLVYRYCDADGLPGGEGAFLTCSFWLVDDLALGGQLDAAHRLFERLIGHANDVGLLAEEIDPATGEQLGNFPQGFTHLALIRAAVNLAKAAKYGAEEQAESEAERAHRARRAAPAAPQPGPA